MGPKRCRRAPNDAPSRRAWQRTATHASPHRHWPRRICGLGGPADRDSRPATPPALVSVAKRKGRDQGCIRREGGLKRGMGGRQGPPPPRFPIWSPPKAGQNCLRLNPLGTEATFWLSASNIGTGAVQRGVPPPPPPVYGRSNTSLAGTLPSFKQRKTRVPPRDVWGTRTSTAAIQHHPSGGPETSLDRAAVFSTGKPTEAHQKAGLGPCGLTSRPQ